MLAVINLLVYILKYPTHPAVQSDLALLDIVAGHFGHIHILTSSHVTFTFAREVAGLANDTVQRAALQVGENGKEDDAVMNGLDAAPNLMADDLVSLPHYPVYASHIY